MKDDTKYTLEDIEKMPDGKRAELVDGEIFMMATPSRKHQRVLGELYSTVSDYIKKKVENAK